uniref:Putative secreted protein n=1 Tax=Amblyomma americanum TaxID=6943 RepID=A0A0C9SF20_AMBAM
MTFRLASYFPHSTVALLAVAVECFHFVCSASATLRDELAGCKIVSMGKGRYDVGIELNRELDHKWNWAVVLNQITCPLFVVMLLLHVPFPHFICLSLSLPKLALHSKGFSVTTWSGFESCGYEDMLWHLLPEATALCCAFSKLLT